MQDDSILPPKSTQVAKVIKGEIQAGLLKPGSRAYSIRNLAKRFKVSNKVVVTAYNMLEQEGLIEREHGRGTFIKDQNTGGAVGVFTKYTMDTDPGFFMSLQNATDKRRTLYIPLGWAEMAEDLSFKLAQLKNHGAKGLFLVLRDPNPLMWENLQSTLGDFPYILVYQWHNAKPPPAPAVLLDYVSQFKQGLAYLLDKGHKNIFIAGSLDWHMPLFKKWAKAALKQLGKENQFKDLVFFFQRDLMQNPNLLDPYFKKKNQPTALVTTFDYLAWYIYKFISKRYPNHASLELVGGNDTEWSKQEEKPFHSFEIPFETIWDKAFKAIENFGPANQIEWVSPKLIIRDQNP